MGDDWISVTEAVDISGYHGEHIRKLIRAKRIKARKFATVWQMSRKSLEAYVNEQTQRGEKRGRKPKGT